MSHSAVGLQPICEPCEPPHETTNDDARRYSLALLATIVFDLASSVTLFYTYQSTTPWSFSRGTADMLLLCAARILCLMVLAPVASYQQALQLDQQPIDVEKGVSYAPLEATNSRDWSAYRKNAALGALFAISTVSQVYVGAKCIGFQFGEQTEAWLGPLLGCAVIFINLEAWLLKLYVDQKTADKGQLFPSLHQHSLVYKDGLTARKCNMCSKQIRGKSRDAWICTKKCPFAVCSQCVATHASKQEKQVRGDSGTKQEIVVSNKAYFLKALTFARPHWLLFVLAFSSLALQKGASMALPAIQGHILDSIISEEQSDFRFYVQCMLGFSIAVGLFGGLRGLFFNLATRRMAVSVRNMLFRHIVSQDTVFFDGTTVGDLTSRLNGDVQAMVTPCQRSLQSLMSNSLTLLVGLAMCFATSWRLSMLAFAAICPIIFLTETYAKWSSEINKQIRTDLGDASNVAVEALSNIRTVKMFSTEDLEQRKYEEWTLSALKKTVKDAVGGACTAGLNNYLDLGAGVIILLCGGSMAMNGQQVTVGDLITFQLYWGRMQGAIKGLNDITMSFTRAAGAAQRVLSLLDSKPDITATEGETVETVQGDVQFDNVSFVYQLRPAQKVLDGLNLTIKQGRVTALVGPSGGGKSTVLHLLMRLYNPKDGKIMLDGKDLASLCLQDVHKHVCLVSQDPQLFGGTIFENITYGVEPTPILEHVIEAAKQAHAHDFIQKMEEGYDTRVGERGVRLSGGQKQRISIARVLLRQPKLILLDEATSALDVESEALVQAALDDLMAMQDTTVLVVAHRLSTVVNADQIVVLESGSAVEAGTHKELLSQDGVYKRLVSKQLVASASGAGVASVAATVAGAAGIAVAI